MDPPPALPAVADPETAALAALEAVRREGYYRARVDSVVAEGGGGAVYLSRGPRAPVASVTLEGVSALDGGGLRDGFRTRAGRPLDPDILADDLGGVLRAYERAGYPLARAEITAIDLREEGLHVIIQVEEGVQPDLIGLELVAAGGEAVRTDARFAARAAGLQPGRPLSGYDPERVRRDLEATGLFEAVGVPEVALGPGGAVLRVPVREAVPGAVDLVLGYLPPAGGEGGRVVGSGSLLLRNLFGRGRVLGVDLVRNAGLVASLDVRVADPFVAGLPLRLEGRFAGYQQDSTFSRQELTAEAGLRVASGLELIGSASRIAVEAGIAGAAPFGGRPLVPEASGWFAGLGLRFARVDRPASPRSGLAASVLAERGAKRRALPDSLLEPVSLPQQRLLAAARVYLPTFARQGAVLGGDAAALLADAYDDSDLFRFGGAASLRGYDEERFRGNVVARAFAEYRYFLDRDAFAFAFLDLGYVRRPATPGVPADERTAPGYGLGLVTRTPLGLITATYALNPEDGPTGGRVHLGLSLGL